jgi:uncharacterized protein (TIGR04141 family)
MTPDLGVKVAFNLLSEAPAVGVWTPARVRSLRTKSLSADRLVNEAQSPRDEQISTFAIDARKDLLRGITGQPTDADTWGRLVTGSISVQVKRPEVADGLTALCVKLEEQYHSIEYKKHYPWIDDLRPIVDAALYTQVIAAIVSSISNGAHSAFDLCPPALVDWARVKAFTYSIEPKREYSDTSLDDFVSALIRNDALADLTAEHLRNDIAVVALDSEIDGEELASWSVLECLSGSVFVNGQTYIVEAGAVYAVQSRFLVELNGYIDQIPVDQLSLPSYGSSKNERQYNRKVSKSLGGVFLDGQFVRRPDATTIELCDVALPHPSLTLLHVKRGRGSGETSYVFAQAAASAELVAFDSAFCDAARNLIRKLDRPSHFFGKSSPSGLTKALTPILSPTDRRVAIGLVASWKAHSPLSAQLSFFGKITGRMVLEKLRRYGFSVSIERISM